MVDLVALKAELLAGHPGTGAYNVDDASAAVELNALNREAPADPRALIDYLLTNEHRGENLYGRIAYVANAKAGDSAPLDDTETGITMTLKHVAAGQAFLKYADPALGAISSLAGTAFDGILDALAGGGTNAQCMGPAHKTAIQALSQNKQSRAQELGFGIVREGQVTAARAL